MITFIKDLLKNKERNYVLVAQILNTLIALITGKLIATYILPEDFGAYSLQWAAYTFFTSIMVNPFIQFIKSTSGTLLPKIGSKPYIITSAVSIFIAFNLIIIFLHVYYEILDFILFGILFCYLIISTIYKVLANYLNTENKLLAYSKLGVLKSFSGLAFITLYFILSLTFLDNVLVLWLIQLAGVLVGCLIFISNYRIFISRFKIGFNTFLKKYLNFSAPLMIMAIWVWINNYFDRYAIEYFLTLRDVGNYNASYSVGSKVFLMLAPIFGTLLTPIIYRREKVEIKKKAMQKYAVYYLILAAPIFIIVFFFRDVIGNVLLSENYSEGFFLIFWIALAYFVLTLTQLYELIFYAEFKTRVILIGSMMSAIVNIVLNLLFIPKFGIFGAGIATCIGFSIYFFIVFINLKKLN